jgi:hypothetical protein
MVVLQPTHVHMAAELSPLRRRMIEDMTIRNLSPATQRSYMNAVQKFSRYFGRSSDRLELGDVHAFQVHLVSTGISSASLNQIVSALRLASRWGRAMCPSGSRIPASRAHSQLFCRLTRSFNSSRQFGW